MGCVRKSTSFLMTVKGFSSNIISEERREGSHKVRGGRAPVRCCKCKGPEV